MTNGPLLVSKCALNTAGAFSVSLAGVLSFALLKSAFPVCAAAPRVIVASATAATPIITIERSNIYLSSLLCSFCVWRFAVFVNCKFRIVNYSNVQRSLSRHHRLAADAYAGDLAAGGPDRDVHVAWTAHLHALQAQHRTGLLPSRPLVP